MCHLNKILLFVFSFLSLNIFAQEGLTYQKPPQEILELADVELAPTPYMDDRSEFMVLVYRDAYKSIDELSQNELRLAGLRINPDRNIGSRVTYYRKLEVKKANSKTATQVTDLPEQPQLSNFLWSHDQKKMAFTHTGSEGVELWVLDVKNASAKKISNTILNANMGRPMIWFKDDRSLLVRALPEDKKELTIRDNVVPTGPTISVSDGAKAQNRTYQDLLKNPVDEQNFEILATSELVKIGLDGVVQKWAEAAMYDRMTFSPDGHLILISRVERPFSYIVPYYRFPEITAIYKESGELVEVVNEVPLTEVLPKGFMASRTGRRSINWRADRPATIYWAEALDGGDPETEVEYRDAVYQLSAPFTGDPQLLIKTKDRYRGVAWGNDEHAFAYDYWWNTRNTRIYEFDPNDNSREPKILSDRNYQDIYSDPGGPMFVDNDYGRSVVYIENDKVFLAGDGHTPEGQFPFIDEFHLNTLKTERIYQSPYKDKLENILRPVNMEKRCFLVRLESPNEFPNYYIRDLKKGNELTQITYNVNPFKGLENVHKELIKYKRNDGLELSGTLYLPPGYDMEKKEKLPMLLWAYPREYKDKSSAGQTASNPNAFTYPYYGSFIYWVMRGYAVLDDAAFPIVGEGDAEPNDDFREQLVANGKAAIDALDSLGYIDRSRVGVGGHSYGAFMVANLLSHCDYFAAGIARSGAYNRTLTPFGFQSEERSYWDAPEVYYTMSPFMHADKMDEPLLLIHGEADNNSGTYPMQSERYFNALKGLGSTARLVILPKESHGYRAKESILHLLWEQDQWLEKYVKNKK